MSQSVHTPLPPNDSKGPKLLIVSTIMCVISCSFFTARCYTRIRPTYILGWVDYLLGLGVLNAIVVLGLSYAGVRYGVGRHLSYIKPTDISKAIRILYLIQIFWTFAITLIKVSVSLMLLQLTRDKRTKMGIWCLCGLCVTAGVAATIILLVECMPVQALWNRTMPGAKCWSAEDIEVSLYCTAAIFFVSDLACSLFPLTFIRQLQRPLKDKIILSALMMMGLVASAFAIAKLFFIDEYIKFEDPLYAAIDAGLLGVVEMHLGIIAASAPCLKGPLTRALRKLGVATTTIAQKSARNSTTRSSMALNKSAAESRVQC